MKEQQWTFRERTGWEPGPWDDEPDKVQWTDAATGLPCMIHRGTFGAWCGYVGVSSAHPAHGNAGSNLDLTVHGGLNFADGCDHDFDPATGRGVCHVPEPGEPDDVWWLGFDCGHAWDTQPGLDAQLRQISGLPDVLSSKVGSVYRDMAYVRAECTLLALQLHQMT